jgi:cytochrome c oxidase assembly factor CtaG
LAAAYVLGYKVTKADMAQCSHIRPAEGETDTGVTICYNTVKKPVVIATIIMLGEFYLQHILSLFDILFQSEYTSIVIPRHLLSYLAIGTISTHEVIT